MARQIRLGGLKYDLELGIAKFTQAIQNASASMRAMQKNFEQTTRNIGTVFKAITTAYAVQQVRNLSAAISDLAEKGEVAGSIEEGFKALGGSTAEIDKAKKATIGLVDGFDLMATASKGLTARVPEFNQNFSLIADLGARVANTLGTDTKTEIEKLTDAVIKGSSKGLAPYGFQLEGLKTKGERWHAVMEQLPTVMNRYAEVTDSAANAQTAFNVAMEEGLKRAGIAINNNQRLNESFREMARAIEDADWERLGEGLANIQDVLLNLSTTVLPSVIKYIEEFAYGLEKLDGNSVRAKMVGIKEDIASIDQELQKLSQPRKGGKALHWIEDSLFGSIEERVKALQQEKADLEKAAKSGMDAMRIQRENETLSFEKESKKRQDIAKKSAEEIAREEERIAAASAAKITDNLREKLRDLKQKGVLEGLKDQLDTAIAGQDRAGFEALMQKFRQVTADGIRAGFADLKSPGDLLELEDYIKQHTDQAAAELEAKYQKEELEAKEANQRIADDKRDKLEQAYREAADTYQSVFRDAISGEFGTWEDQLEDLAIGFASSLAAALDTNVEDLEKGMVGVGESLGKAVASGWASLFGSSEDRAAGVQGPPMENGQFVQKGTDWSSLIQTGLIIGGATANAEDRNKKNKDNSGTGGAAGAAVGAVIGGVLGVGIFSWATAAIGAAIGQVLGSAIGGMLKTGTGNPATEARHAFANYIEESFQKLGAVQFYDKDGKLQTTKGDMFNFLEGDKKRFEVDHVMGNWGDKFREHGEEAIKVFGGLGEALEEVLGLTEDVGQQIGFLMAENFAGNIDNARLLVQQLGLSFEDLEKKLVEAGRSGEMRWHEVEVALQGAAEAFEPGRKAVGDVKGAIDSLIQSGGRGVAALKGVRDAAVEAMEKGAKTLQDMRALMLQQGADPEFVEAFMQALEQRGIRTLEELANAEDRLAGGIVADIESLSESTRKMWEEMTTQLMTINEQLEKIPEKVNVEFDVTSNVDGDTRALIDSGMLEAGSLNTSGGEDFEEEDPIETEEARLQRSRARRGLMGGRTPDYIRRRGEGPRRSRSMSGISERSSRPITIVVNAEGAEAGVEARILDALATVQQNAIRGAVDALIDAGV